MERKSITKNKTILMLLIIACIILLPKVINATSFSVSGPKSAQPGETVTITINCSGLYGRFNLSASNATLSKNSVFSQGSNVSITATVGNSGTAKITITADDVSDSSENPVSNSPQSCSISIKAPSNPGGNGGESDDDGVPGGTSTPTTTAKNSNNYLKSLSVSVGSINFNKRTQKYTINVPEETESITVSAAKEHDKATLTGDGTVALKKGNNTIRVAVTAENGSVRTYTLTVIRAGAAEEQKPDEQQENPEETPEDIEGLTSLKLKGVKDNGEIVDILLSPEFSKDIFYYECEIPEGVTFIDVEQECDILDAIIEVTGNENLQDGENLINIIIKYTDENGEEQTITYQIAGKKQVVEAIQEIEQEEGLSPIQIGIIVGSISIATIIIIVLTVIYRKQQNRGLEEEFGGYGEPFYNEEEEDDIFEKPLGQQEEIEEETEKEEASDAEEEEIKDEMPKIKEEDFGEWEDFEPKKRRRFGKNAKKGKHF